MEKILEYPIKCPICGSEIMVNEYLYEAPYVGKIIIASGVCPSCRYKWSDVRLAESRGPQRLIYRVENVKDLNALVIRSSTATVKVPELGVEIIPGYASRGYITTVEGLVMDIYEKTKYLCSEEDAPRDKCVEKLEILEKAINGEITFTVVIEDPMGVSDIVSSKTIRESMEKSS